MERFSKRGTGILLNLIIATLISLLICPASSTAGPEIITRIEVKGNRRIEADAIRAAMSSRAGDYFSQESVSEDIRRIYRMGYFSDVQVELSQGDLGPLLTVLVKERPYLSAVKFEGMNEVLEESLKEAVTVRPYTIYSMERVRESVEKMEALYEEKGFFLADISHRLIAEGEETVLLFHIREGKKVRIRKINLLGNREMSDRQLLKLMETREGGYFSWLTDSGKFEEETLHKDVDLLTSFYYNNGFVQVKIGEPRVFMSPDKKWLNITLRIEEGAQFRVGRIDFSGDLAAGEEKPAEIPATLKTKGGGDLQPG